MEFKTRLKQIFIGGYVFNYQNRMADALGADIPKDKIKRAGAMLNLAGRAMLRNRRSEGEMTACGGAIPAEVEVMVNSVTHGPGDAPVALRQAIFRRGMAHLGFPETETGVPDGLAHYVDTIARHAPEITDQDVKDLLAAGWTEAEVFEITVAASVAVGYGRLRIAWDGLAQAQQRA